MEYIWYIIASLGAGIGTGLAGLSAATVMVPMLIVLCPSFSGETGAYHATAIALASDILGSAVASAIYIRHKNIDLKRGSVMLVCILSMCIAGSFAAWKAGHIVLGNFSLFLTFCIGIRFLVKPDTQRKDPIDSGTGLDIKGIIISLFFGLTIGFGAGFVGTGGGMMMLVVFTAFLGMNQKSAVGTSTFIMTFTALIASVSHIFIDPSIISDRWDALLICIVVSTSASIISARFANRASNRTVGLAIGGCLTLLGGAMLFLYYKDYLFRFTLLTDILICLRKYLVYLACCIIVMLIFWTLLRISKESRRKCLHAIAFTSSLFMVAVSRNWLVPALCCLVFGIVVYPILYALEKHPRYDELFVQRRPGEIKKSLLLLFFSHSFLIAVCWGWLDKPHAFITAVLAWGTGDTMAALIGKRFGKHKVRLPHADPKKTWEGTAANAVTAFIVSFLSLLFSAPFSPIQCLGIAFLVAPVAAAVELFSHNGNDTVSVPAAAALCILFF